MLSSPGRRIRVAGGLALVVLLTALLRLALAPADQSPEAAPEGGSRACASVVSAVPESVAGNERRETTAPGTAVWGDGRITLRCGVPPLSPTLDLCMSVNGVDWVLDEARAQDGGPRVLTTYGRDPAIEVAIEDPSPPPGDILVDLNSAAEAIPQGDHTCVSLTDVP